MVQSGHRIIGILMPSGWDAADMTFQVSNSLDGNFRNLYSDDGNEVAVKVAASRAVGFDCDMAHILGPWRFVKVRSGTAASPVTQSAERVIELVTK